MPKSNQNAKVEAVTTEVVDNTSKFNIVELMATHKTKSAVIRHLAAQGLKTSEIVTVFKVAYPNFLYQHARNVLNQKLKGSATAA